MVLTHGVGSRADLPLPFEAVLFGAGTALALSFLLLGMLWPQPRLDGGRAGRPLPAGIARVLGSTPWRWAVGGLGLLALLWTLVAAFAGPQDTRNALPYVVFVLVWVGLVPLSWLFGPTTWARLSPVRTLHAALCRAFRLDPGTGVLAMPRWGWWPGAGGLLLFVWLELVVPGSTQVSVLRLWVVAYLVLHVFVGLLFGNGWFSRGDPFEVWSRLFGQMSVWGRDDRGTLVLRHPLAGLDQLPWRGDQGRGLAATAAVMLGSSAFDSLREHPSYAGWTQTGALRATLVDTLALVATVLVVGIAFVGCARSADAVSGHAVAGRATPGGVAAFAPSLVPVAGGYVVAHYYSLLAFEGQNSLIRLSDPLARGWNLLDLTGATAEPAVIAPSLVVWVQVLAVVTGHVLGVVVAHDRAVRLFPRHRAVAGQLPLVALMVVYTCAGLLLLFAA